MERHHLGGVWEWSEVGHREGVEVGQEYGERLWGGVSGDEGVLHQPLAPGKAPPIGLKQMCQGRPV